MLATVHEVECHLLPPEDSRQWTWLPNATNLFQLSEYNRKGVTTNGTNTHARQSQPHRHTQRNFPFELIEPNRVFSWNDTTRHQQPRYEPPHDSLDDPSYDLSHQQHQPAPNARPDRNGR